MKKTKNPNTWHRCMLSLALMAAMPATAGAQGGAAFPLSQVRLLPSRFQDNFKRDSAWMMSIPVRALLHSFRTASGSFTDKEGGYMTMHKLGGWESLDCDLRGHTTGHLLSALATLYAQTGSEEVKTKADSIVSGLAEVQSAFARNGFLSAFPEGLIDRNIRGQSVWAPWYTLHKILQGLIDQYRLCHNEDALAIARRMGQWAYDKVSPLDEHTRQRMIRNEFGGYNEAMYELYALTRDERFLKVARFFYHDEKIDPLKAGNSHLGTNHANTFIPKLLGEARNYELFHNPQSRYASELLLQTLIHSHAFVTGELSDKEHLFDPQEQSRHLTGYDGENCCTFNLLKLAEHVYAWNIASERTREDITAYYERALYNHILGQQDPHSSMVCYFTPLQTGSYRLYSTRDSSFWCCVGSGFESHVRYASFIYGHARDQLFVNLLIPSRLDWDGTQLTQTTDFPLSGHVSYRITGLPKTFTLHLRRPVWATSVRVKVNGRKASTTVRRLWKDGDIIEVDYGMALRAEPTKDDPTRIALLYGPIVLSGRLGSVARPFSDPRRYNDYYTFDYQIPAQLEQQTVIRGTADLMPTGPLRFRTKTGIELQPFYDAHHERYVIYWKKQ